MNDTIVEDKSPAAALLDSENVIVTDFNPYGNLPITLWQNVRIHFSVIPNSEVVSKIRLRFGTYCRANTCHLTIQWRGHTRCVMNFSTEQLQDNQYVDIALPLPQRCTPGQPVDITLYSTDATENNVVAVWCSRKLPLFLRTLSLNPLRLPAISAPRVSIVIPVFNKVLYTYNCLLTICQCDQEIDKEVIIINNASSDETTTLLSQLSGAFTVINNAKNLGFVEACRQGAEIAKGEFVLFLNNDTQVTPGWLANLLRKIESDKNIGIVGSKLIYPNGRLQEAGGIIFSDASGWNYGRLQDPTDPRFDQSRSVDYCSGASLMIRQALWQKMGGFDLRYAPAYYEDTDLCFAVRQAGYQVVYCHDSEVVHHEGITAGTDTSSGYKAYQVINQRKFVEKWAEFLKNHHLPPGSDPEVAAHYRK